MAKKKKDPECEQTTCEECVHSFTDTDVLWCSKFPPSGSSVLHGTPADTSQCPIEDNRNFYIKEKQKRIAREWENSIEGHLIRIERILLNIDQKLTFQQHRMGYHDVDEFYPEQ